jgi:membrane protein
MKKYLDLFKQTFTEFGEDKAPRLGAALAYYTIFSLAPLLLIAIAVAGFIFGKEAATTGITDELSRVMGPTAAKSIQEMVASAGKSKEGGTIATILGVVMLLFGASGVFGQLKDALNTIWNVEAKKSAGIIGFIRERFLSMAMVMGVAFLLLVSLILDAGITLMNDYIDRLMPGGSILVHALQLIISFGIVTVAFAMIFRYLPDVRPAWKDTWFGAAFTSLLFVLGKFGLGLYLGKAAPGSSFGAAGSLVILLIWVYWSAQILFFGAEFTQVYARTRGSMIGDDSKARAKQTAERVEDRPKAQTPPGGKGRPQPAPAYGRSAPPRPASGGKGKLAVGGVAGLVVGTFVGVLTTAIVAVKSVKKILTIPFR